MTQPPSVVFKIPTKSAQPARGKPARPAGRLKPGRPAASRVFAYGTGRSATRGGGEIIELEHGITVYPARDEPGRLSRPRSRAAGTVDTPVQVWVTPSRSRLSRGLRLAVPRRGRRHDAARGERRSPG